MPKKLKIYGSALIRKYTYVLGRDVESLVIKQINNATTESIVVVRQPDASCGFMTTLISAEISARALPRPSKKVPSKNLSGERAFRSIS